MWKTSGGIVLGGLEGWTTSSFPSCSLSSLSLLVLQFCLRKFQHYLVETDFGASVRAWRVRKEMDRHCETLMREGSFIHFGGRESIFGKVAFLLTLEEGEGPRHCTREGRESLASKRPCYVRTWHAWGTCVLVH